MSCCERGRNRVEHYFGDSLLWEWLVYAEDGTQVDLTDATATLKITQNGLQQLLASATTEDGMFVVEVTATDMAELEVGEYCFSFIAVFADESVHTLEVGCLEIVDNCVAPEPLAN